MRVEDARVLVAHATAEPPFQIQELEPGIVEPLAEAIELGLDGVQWNAFGPLAG